MSGSEAVPTQRFTSVGSSKASSDALRCRVGAIEGEFEGDGEVARRRVIHHALLSRLDTAPGRGGRTVEVNKVGETADAD
jgi:hypothetical protein